MLSSLTLGSLYHLAALATTFFVSICHRVDLLAGRHEILVAGCLYSGASCFLHRFAARNSRRVPLELKPASGCLRVRESQRLE